MFILYLMKKLGSLVAVGIVKEAFLAPVGRMIKSKPENNAAGDSQITEASQETKQDQETKDNRVTQESQITRENQVTRITEFNRFTKVTRDNRVTQESRITRVVQTKGVISPPNRTGVNDG